MPSGSMASGFGSVAGLPAPSPLGSGPASGFSPSKGEAAPSFSSAAMTETGLLMTWLSSNRSMVTLKFECERKYRQSPSGPNEGLTQSWKPSVTGQVFPDSRLYRKIRLLRLYWTREKATHRESGDQA